MGGKEIAYGWTRRLDRVDRHRSPPVDGSGRPVGQRLRVGMGAITGVRVYVIGERTYGRYGWMRDVAVRLAAHYGLSSDAPASSSRLNKKGPYSLNVRDAANTAPLYIYPTEPQNSYDSLRRRPPRAGLCWYEMWWVGHPRDCGQ